MSLCNGQCDISKVTLCFMGTFVTFFFLHHVRALLMMDHHDEYGDI